MEKSPHIALFQSPGMGHLIPIVEFAKRMISYQSVSSTIIIPTDGPISSSQLLFLDDLPNGINYIILPPVNLQDLIDFKQENRISLIVSGSLPFLRNAIESLVSSKNLVALVLDLFTTDGIDVAREFNVSPYIFWASNALSLAFMNYLPKLDESVKCEFRELTVPIRVPGCVPISGKDLMEPVQDRKNYVYKFMMHNAERLKLADGIILNTFEDLESKTLNALLSHQYVAQVEQVTPSLYPIGPLVQINMHSDGTDASGCLSWMDNQPRSSVVFVSFGSGGTLSYRQFTELAFGLEESGQRFIWVIRSPDDKAANAAYFGDTNKNDPFAYLPEGFLERTKGRGLIVSSWAPQAAILANVATGGFVTHCGWNSILESVVNGVPLIAWPLYAEQKMNAELITHDFEVALRPKVNENGLVKREEIANVVRNLMEGEKGKVIREKMRYLQEGSVMALSENGDSTKSLAQLACLWKNNNAS